GMDPKERAQFYDRDGTLAKVPSGTKASFDFGEYTFVYENLQHTSDDHKDAITATVSVWRADDEIAVLYPAKWTFAKGEQQQTTEVAIKVRWATEFGFLRHNEDIYVVLTGYNTESKQANFRVYLNPLISWVWIGFFVLAAGVFICLIPPGLVRRPPATPGRRGARAAGVG